MKNALFLLALLLLCCKPAATPESGVPELPKVPSPASLGTYSQIALSVTDLNISRAFYEKLGFKVLSQEQRPFPAAALSDGVIHLRLEQNNFASPRLDYVFGSATERDQHVKQLRDLAIPTTRTAGLVEFTDPNGLRVGLAVRPNLPPTPPNQSHATAGDFGEFAIHTADLQRSLDFWKKLGYDGRTFDQPHPWAILRDGVMILGFHQSNEFTQPTITYFVQDHAATIARLKQQGLSVKNEKPGHATLTSPDGQNIFVFTGE